MALDEPPDEDAVPQPRRIPKPALIGCGLLLAAAAIGGTAYYNAETTPEPEVLFAQSLDMIDRGDWVRAHNVGAYLRDNDYADLDFGGGVSFVLGESAFQLGDRFSLDDHTRGQNYREAARELSQAAKDGVPSRWRAAWTRSLGLSLYRLGRLAEAEPRLAEAAQDGDPVCLLALGHCRLVPAYEDRIQADEVAATCEELLARDELERALAAEAGLLRIDAWFESGRLTEIAEALETTDWLPLPPDAPALTLRRARLSLANSDPQTAERLTHAVLHQAELDPETLREAAYWHARAAEIDGRDTEAILRFRSVLDNYDPGDETVVSAVRLADLLRRAPRVLFEDALRAYGRAVQINTRPENYRNRYMRLPELRRRVRTAWEEWLAENHYEWAIELAEQMAPLFEVYEAAEMAALAAHRQATQRQAEHDAADADRRTSLRSETLRLWRSSGHAYERLAEALIVRAGYQDALWTSFEHLRAGHDFDAAQRQLERFLETQTQTRRPQALVEYGRLLLDRHEPGDQSLDQAAETFRSVLDNYPTSDAAFDATLWLGICHLERNEPDEAAARWESLLESPLLTPESQVWQGALVSLGSLLFHTGELRALDARRAEQAGELDRTRDRTREANQSWTQAVRKLTGYLARTGYSRQSAEARFWLAKSLQRVTELPRTQLGAAETNNARIELQRQIDASLKRAIEELRTLIAQLQPRAERNRLDAMESRLLRDCTFEIAHTAFALGDHKMAVEKYGDAINRFPNDPQVLLAYVQIATCYDQLGRRTEAISYLERAQLIRGQFDETNFDAELSSLSGPEWEVWLKRNVELLKKAEG